MPEFAGDVELGSVLWHPPSAAVTKATQGRTCRIKRLKCMILPSLDAELWGDADMGLMTRLHGHTSRSCENLPPPEPPAQRLLRPARLVGLRKWR